MMPHAESGHTGGVAARRLSFGFSAGARRANVATGSAIFVWLALVFATDLGLTGAQVSAGR